MSRLLSAFPCFALGLSVVSCSNSSSGGSTPGTGTLTTTGSCAYADQNLCMELYSTAVIEQYRTYCTQSNGTFSATTGCRTEGRRKGCQHNLQNVKTNTNWAYDDTSADLVQSVCLQMASQAQGQAQGLSYTVVNP